MALSAKQRRFCEEYIKDSNATQAAIRAGYAENSAKQQGARLLTKDDVADHIKKLSAPILKSAEITRDDHLEQLRKLRDMAIEAGNVQAATRAEELRGKVCGHYIERKADVDSEGNDVVKAIEVKFVGVGK